MRDMYDLKIQEDDIRQMKEGVTAFGPYGEGNPERVYRLDRRRVALYYGLSGYEPERGENDVVCRTSEAG